MKTKAVTLQDLIEKNLTTAECRRIESSPHMDGPTNQMRHFRVTLHNGKTGHWFALALSHGLAHTENPAASDVLNCLAMDAAGVENARTFEDWCSEYGLDTDSRKAERTYRVCKAQADKLKELMGIDYKTLLWDVERL